MMRLQAFMGIHSLAKEIQSSFKQILSFKACGCLFVSQESFKVCVSYIVV